MTIGKIIHRLKMRRATSHLPLAPIAMARPHSESSFPRNFIWERKSKVSERKGNEGDGNSQCENEGDYIFPSPSTCLMNGIGAHQVKLSLCTVLQYAGISGMKYHVILRSWYQADTGTMSNTPEPTLFFFFFVVQYLPPSLFFRKVSSPAGGDENRDENL